MTQFWHLSLTESLQVLCLELWIALCLILMKWDKITRCVDLLNLQKHKTYTVAFGGGFYVECLTLYILESSGMFHHDLTMSFHIGFKADFFRAPDYVKCLGNPLQKWDRKLNCILLLDQLLHEGIYFLD